MAKLTKFKPIQEASSKLFAFDDDAFLSSDDEVATKATTTAVTKLKKSNLSKAKTSPKSMKAQKHGNGKKRNQNNKPGKEMEEEVEKEEEEEEDQGDDEEEEMNDFQFEDSSQWLPSQLLIESKINDLLNQKNPSKLKHPLETNQKNLKLNPSKLERKPDTQKKNQDTSLLSASENESSSEDGSEEDDDAQINELNEQEDGVEHSDEETENDSLTSNSDSELDHSEDEQDDLREANGKNKKEDSDDDDLSIEEESEDILREKEIQKKLEFFEIPEDTNQMQSTLSFDQMNLSRPILKALSQMGIASPTPIQSKAIPYGLLGKDIVGSAMTGSGKTLAFMLPILERLLFRPKQIAVTRVLILVPTRELALQCHSVAKQLCQCTDIQVGLAVGGLHLKQQEAELKKRPDILIATPGRLIDFIKNTVSFNLDALEILVLDEADRMLEEGFEDELNEIILNTPKSRQTMLFSATMTDNVDQLVKLSLNRPVRLFVDPKSSTSLRLTQEFIRIRPHREQDKLAILLALCKRTIKTNSILFFQSKKSVHQACLLFQLVGLKAVELHGDLTQAERLRSLEKFKAMQVDYLLATDVASRGLDIPFVQCVINVDMPFSLDLYLHRVGRTARAGRPGRSISLIIESDRKLLREILTTPSSSVKQRVIRKEVIEKYAKKLQHAQTKLPLILEEEKKEKELQLLEQQVQKAENMIQHKQEIFSRPKRIWFKNEVHTKKKQSSQLKRKRDIDDDVHLQRENRKAIKLAKRSQRASRSQLVDSSSSFASKSKVHKKSSGNGGSSKKKSKTSRFKNELIKVTSKKHKLNKSIQSSKSKKPKKSERKGKLKQKKAKQNGKRKR